MRRGEEETKTEVRRRDVNSTGEEEDERDKEVERWVRTCSSAVRPWILFGGVWYGDGTSLGSLMSQVNRREKEEM